MCVRATHYLEDIIFDACRFAKILRVKSRSDARVRYISEGSQHWDLDLGISSVGSRSWDLKFEISIVGSQCWDPDLGILILGCVGSFVCDGCSIFRYAAEL